MSKWITHFQLVTPVNAVRLRSKPAKGGYARHVYRIEVRQAGSSRHFLDKEFDEQEPAWDRFRWWADKHLDHFDEQCKVNHQFGGMDAKIWSTET